MREVPGVCPLDCPDTCSWVVTVKDGRAVRLQGDAEHPFTRGVLCNKVNGYLAYAQSPDRLLYPMRRRGPKGSGELERISWEEALDEIADRFAGTIREFGPEAIWPYLGSGSMGQQHKTKRGCAQSAPVSHSARQHSCFSGRERRREPARPPSRQRRA